MSKHHHSENGVELHAALERYIELCTRLYERMERENSWPWVVDPEDWKKLMPATQRGLNESPSDGEQELQNPQDHR